MPLLDPRMTHQPMQPMGSKGAAVFDFLDQMRRSSGDAVRAGIGGDYEQFGGLLGDAMGPGVLLKGAGLLAPAAGLPWLLKRMWGKPASKSRYGYEKGLDDVPAGGYGDYGYELADAPSMAPAARSPESVERAKDLVKEYNATKDPLRREALEAQMLEEFGGSYSAGIAANPRTEGLPPIPTQGLLGDALKRQSGKLGSKPPRMSREEAIAAGYWHPIGDAKKLKTPFDEMTRETTPAYGLLAQKRADLERMQGGELIPAPGDRSDAGKYLTKVNQTTLANPVLLEGGHGFMRSHSPHGAVWASGKGVVSGLNKQAQAALERGSDPYLGYLPMGHGAMDFNTMMSDAVLEQIRGGNISKTAKQMFDRKMRKLRPEWLGIDHPQAVPMLESNGALRHAFMDTAQLEDFQRRGFPDLAATRKAITDPDLYNTGLLHGGQSFGRLSGQVIDAPAMPHKTYDTQLGGEYVGGINEGIPPQLMFPDFYAGRRAAGKPPQSDYRSFSLSSHSQPMNQEWLDNIMDYLGRNPQAN